MMASIGEWPHATITEAVYTPRDLERISGLRADMQRVWRRRGQLPALGSGHARFSISQTLEVTIRYALSKIGVPLGEIDFDLSEATSAAMAHAIFTHGGCEVIGPADVVDAFLHEFAEGDGKLGLSLVGSPNRLHYLVLNEWHEARIVDRPDDIVSKNDELNIVFNLPLIGARLVERGRKPVITVRFPDQPGQRTVRRLTGVGANDS